MLQFQPQEHLLHSYIVASQSEQARDRLSLDLAAAMLCRSDGVRPCRTCRDCRKVYDGVHPDVIYIAPDPDAKVPSIKVDQIRGVAATAYILPSEAEKKVYVLRQADTMNLNAQNAFLKLLEEPPQSAAFILAAASPELLLPTVRSRCALLRDPAEQLQESDEIRALAEDYLRAVASQNRLTLLRWCLAQEGMDAQTLSAFLPAVQHRLVHLLAEPDETVLPQALCAQQQALDSTRRKIDAQRARYERDQRNAKARLQRMSAREKAVLREKERQEEQLDTAIAELQKLTKGNKAGASFSTRTSNLNLPVEGGRVKRYRDNMAEITGPKGARITAIYEGKVVDVKRNRITNRFDVYIAHGQYITSYANLNSVSVAKGQTVAKNSAIGVIGPAVDIQTMKTEYRLVFGIYPPAGAKKMRASDCFRK